MRFFHERMPCNFVAQKEGKVALIKDIIKNLFYPFIMAVTTNIWANSLFQVIKLQFLPFSVKTGRRFNVNLTSEDIKLTLERRQIFACI